MQEVDRLGWAAQSTFLVGEYYLGVRTGDHDSDRLLRRVLAAHLVGDVDAPANFSLLLGRASHPHRGLRSFSLLYRSSSLVTRTRDPRRAVEALLSYLDVYRAGAHDGVAAVPAAAAVADGRAFLLPPSTLRPLKQVQPRLQRLGVSLVDAPHSLVDLASAELVVAEAGLVVDRRPLEELGAPADLGTETPRVTPGRYPLDGWALAAAEDVQGPLSRARAVAAALAVMPGDVEDRVALARDLAALFSTVRPLAVWYRSVDDVLDAVRHLVDPSGRRS